MAAPTNLSFEDPDATPGSALGWTLTVTSSAESVADFDAASLPFESFDGWDAGFSFRFVGPPPIPGADLAVPNLTSLHVTPKHVEDFEELWLTNQTTLFVLDSPTVASFQGELLGAGHKGLIAPVAMPDPIASLIVPVSGSADGAAVVKAIMNVGIVDESGDITLEQLKLRSPAAGVDSSINMTTIDTGFAGPEFPTHQDIDITADLAPIVGAVGGNWTFKYRDTEDSGNRFFEDITLRFYGARVNYESFASGWSNDIFIISVADWTDGTYGLAADLDAGGGTADTFDWSTLLDEWADVSGTATTATFYLDMFGNPIHHEDFEAVRPPLEFSLDLTSHFFTVPGHGFSTGDIVRFEGEGTLPVPLQRDTDYFVTDITTDDFRVSYVSGGATVDVSTNASGAIRIVRDVARFWVKQMATI